MLPSSGDLHVLPESRVGRSFFGAVSADPGFRESAESASSELYRIAAGKPCGFSFAKPAGRGLFFLVRDLACAVLASVVLKVCLDMRDAETSLQKVSSFAPLKQDTTSTAEPGPTHCTRLKGSAQGTTVRAVARDRRQNDRS